MSEHICPCCGQQMPGGLPVEALENVYFPPTELKIVSALARTYPRGMTARALVDVVYADDPNGGPDGAEHSMRQFIHRARKRMQPYGWRVGGFGRTGQLRLQRIEGQGR